MKRALLIIFGVILLVLGGGGIAAGGLTAAALGTDNSLTAQVGQLQTENAAIYVSAFTLEVDPVDLPAADIQVTATSLNGKELFVGVGTTAAVQDYLAGVGYESVVSLQEGQAETRPVPGTQPVTTAPAAQPIWNASTQGNPATIDWPQRSSVPQVLVVMNADGSYGVAAEVAGSVIVPQGFGLGIGVAVLGLVLFVIGITMLIKGMRRQAASEK